MTFYERLTSLCKERGVEMSELGRFIGMPGLHRSTINRWENGIIPRPGTQKKIADAFKIDVPYLMGKEDVPRPPVRAEADCEHCPCRDRCERCLSPQELQIIKMFRDASEIGKLRMIQQWMSVWEQDQQE